MLRRLDLNSPWRSLDSGFWPSDRPAGCRTVVYGHNGSGKSTVSELLLSLADESSAADLVWEDENKQRTRVAVGRSERALAPAVFTRKWVDANLSAFLDGSSASAIVTLGREAIDARDEEDRLVREIQKLRAEASDAERHHLSTASKLDAMARSVQGQIVAQLRAFDYNHFTRNRYSVPRVQDDLCNYTGDYPDSDAHAEALKRLADDAPQPVDRIRQPPRDAADALRPLEQLLAETPTRVAVASLEGHPQAQEWVERGLELHEDADNCIFCSGQISSDRRAQLARHFDESWLEIRQKAHEMIGVVRAEMQSLTDWHVSLPDPASLAGELQPVFRTAIDTAGGELAERADALQAVEAALSAKAADPSTTPDVPDRSALTRPLSSTVLNEAVNEHNEQVRRYEEVTAERKATVLDHLVGSQSDAFRSLKQQAENSTTDTAARKKAAELAERRLEEVRQSQFTTKDMADTLTRDLARVYGKDHLSVAVTPDGKSYACRRGGKPGTDLSEGERTSLSLLYFLRKLEDEQTPGGDPSQRLVVIDDPSSSLDREALFATHQWLKDTLEGFGQYLVLTHDFSLLRLFLKSHKNAWGKSMKRIGDGNADEARFPKVSFLEMYASNVGGQRRSKVGQLPKLLLNNTSEYAYLFAMVMAGIADSADHERLFLLPNAARRVLEVFASYKAPHRTDFLQALEVLVQEVHGEPFRDVYDFCNRFSHGEGSESIDVLDARAVHSHIRRCMEFLRAVDQEHFNRMCAAVGVSPSVLP